MRASFSQVAVLGLRAQRMLDVRQIDLSVACAHFDRSFVAPGEFTLVVRPPPPLEPHAKCLDYSDELRLS